MSMLHDNTIKLHEHKGHGNLRFLLTPDADERRNIAQELGIVDLKKLRFEGELIPQGRFDWQLKAMLGAGVVQECVVTLEPVTTRIDESVMRLYVRDYQDPDAGEVEMPEDDSVDPLPEVLNLRDVMFEALSLALPAFPRAKGAEIADAQFAAPGTRPLQDADLKPFAALKKLKTTLENKDNAEK